MLARRKFLKVLGIGSVSAPLVAKQAADAEIMKLAGLSTSTFPATDGESGGIPAMGGGDNWYDRQDRAAMWLRAGGQLPEYILENMRRQAEYVEGFDPDIAAKKSWSIAVKVQEQRQRNLQRKINRAKEGSYRVGREAAKKIMGFEWPW